MGRAWVFGDNVSTDSIIPGRFNISNDVNELRKHPFKYARPEFTERVEVGDVVIAGKNFGCGSSREHAAIVLKACGVYLIAKSYGWIFKRNCINTGVLPFEADEELNIIDGDVVEIDLDKFLLKDVTRQKSYRLKNLPDFVFNIHKAGGLVGYINLYGGYFK